MKEGQKDKTTKKKEKQEGKGKEGKKEFVFEDKTVDICKLLEGELKGHITTAPEARW